MCFVLCHCLGKPMGIWIVYSSFVKKKGRKKKEKSIKKEENTQKK